MSPPVGRPLTVREAQLLACYGRTGHHQGVADELGISLSTVKNHLSAIYRKLGASGAIEAFTALGWLRLPGDDEVEELLRERHRLIRRTIDALFDRMTRTPGSSVGDSPSGDPADDPEQGVAVTPASSLRRVG
jgi:DNA-binding CsgD family transcriptional regulator